MPAYTIIGMDGELRQSEIITGLVQFTFDPVTNEAFETRHPHTIIASQDCGLLRDHESGESDVKVLNGVLLFELEPEDDTRRKLSGGDILRRIKRHSEERFHFLKAVSPDQDLLKQGLLNLIVDFRRCFTMSANEINRQCTSIGEGGAKRRCRLEVPYREHLQNRIAFYLQRVALPDEDVP